MDTNYERYFFISGLISITFFVVLVSLVSLFFFHSPKVEQFAIIQSDVINVSISMEETQQQSLNTPEPLVEEPVEKNIEIPKSIPLKEFVPEISDLFSQVKAEKTPKKSQEDVNRRDELNALEKELMEQKDSPRISDRVSKIELAKPSIKMIVQQGSTGPVVNEYYAKIQGLVYTYFRPPNDSIGQSALIRLTISPSGKLIAYKVLRDSSLSSFNQEINWLKDRLNTIRFPEHPEGREAVLEFILTAKEQ